MSQRGRLACLVALIALACNRGPASPAELSAYRAERGPLVSADTTPVPWPGRYAADRVRLVGSTGLVATGMLLHPRSASCRAPGVVLQDGREENSTAVTHLPADFGNVVVLSLDYPADLPYEIDLSSAVLHARRLRHGARQIPALFSLGAAYLAARGDVDSSRLAIAATSFAVPFATIAAAADERFRNVALVYGAGDLSRVVAANLDVHPALLRRPLAWLAMRQFSAFAPERFIGSIAPRPIVMVNGSDDPQMPVSAVQSLYDAARPPKSLIWLRTGHLEPYDTMLIHALVDTAFARLAVLHDAGGSCVAPATR